MKKFVFQMILLIILIVGGAYIYKRDGQIPQLPFLPSPTVYRQVQIDGAKINAEIADTDAKRNKGLGGRSGLASDSGMLFIFPQPSKYAFWMKGMLFPLDFIWIRDNRIIGLLEEVLPPAQGEPDSSLPIYQPSMAVDKVLEVSAGTIKRLNIKIGDIFSQS